MKTKYNVNSNGVNATKTHDKNETEGLQEISNFRRILPQILASSAKNLLLVDLGLAVAFPTIVIPVLRGLQAEKNPNEKLYFTPTQASWFGAIPFICQPIGSVLSGWVSEPIGRRKAMMLVNIPHIIAWIMLHFAQSNEEVFIAVILLGLGVGFMEAPIVTYVGEICQPSIRGILTACAGVAATLGFFCIYLFGTIMTWRNAALACLSVPVATVVAISMVPETPLWLLSKQRKDEAIKSLQWLRGWVSVEHVQKEFTEMQHYSESANSCTKCQKSNQKCNHPPPTITESIKELRRKRTIKPFILVFVCFIFSQFTGLTPMRPYMIQIFQTYHAPIDPNWATVITGLLSFVANIICMCMVRVVGKRKLAMFSVSGTALSCISLGFYAYSVFPPGYSSFTKHQHDELIVPESYFPMIMFFALTFFSSIGISSIPWMLLSEVFPFKSRGIATGITAGLNYLMAFATIKLYLNFENLLSLYGVVWLYGAIGLIGIIVLYFIMPETEKRTLEEIELHFSDNSKSFVDINIQKIQHVTAESHDQETGTNKRDKSEKTDNGNVVGRNSMELESSKGCDNKAFVNN